jgi:hypothetical protein
MRPGIAWALRGWRAVVLLISLALLLPACDTGGHSPPPGDASTLTATSPNPRSTATPAPAETSSGTDLPGALMTEVASGAVGTTPSTLPAEVSDSDRETIYGLTILNLVKNEQATTVYLSPFLGQGERLDESNSAQPLDATLGKYMDSVDGERQYAMSEFSDVVGPLEDGGKVSGGGVFVTLGEIMLDAQSGDTVAVRGTIYRGLGDAEGRLFRFQRDDNAPDGWQLLDARHEWSEQ